MSLFGFVLAIVLCATPAAAAIHPGDEIGVLVYNHPDLSSQSVKVDSRGHVTLLLAGDLKLSGLSTKKAAIVIAKALAPYVKFPAVSVRVVSEAQSIFISGGPGGVLAFSPGETISAALGDMNKTITKSDAGDASGSATDVDALTHSRIDLTRVSLVRNDKTVGKFDVLAMERAGVRGPSLEPGDTLVLVDKPIAVNVSGAVARPGTSYLSANEPLSDAIAQAGGTLPSAASGHITLERPGQPARYVALGDRAFMQPAVNGDSMTIPAAPRVTVVGVVDHPGPAVLVSNFTLLSAIYTAGGPDKYADLHNVEVVHNGVRTTYDVTGLIHGDLSQNPTLRDGDLVLVPQGRRPLLDDIFSALASIAGFAWLVRR